jgi:hypothetical protein
VFGEEGRVWVLLDWDVLVDWGEMETGLRFCEIRGFGLSVTADTRIVGVEFADEPGTLGFDRVFVGVLRNDAAATWVVGEAIVFVGGAGIFRAPRSTPLLLTTRDVSDELTTTFTGALETTVERAIVCAADVVAADVPINSEEVTRSDDSDGT